MKRVGFLVLVMAIFVSLFAPTAAAAFDDISDQATLTATTLLQNLGIVNGYGDGKFHPDDNLTRAQFCKMTVMLSGTQDIAIYEGFTIFPDVRADHWGRGYINAAVRALKIITGFPDGTFKPNANINFAQAVTTVMRLLGYTDSDVGLNWPRSYIDKANQIGLTKGLNLNANDVITRAQAAQIFYNAIFTRNIDGEKYCDELGFTEQKVIILQKNGPSPDNLLRGLVTIGGDGFYPYRSAPDVEEGSQGVLLVDGDGYVLSWAPDIQTKREITVRSTGPMSVIGADGSKINNIPSATLVYINGEMDTWEECWIDIPSGLALRFYYGASGAIDYIFLFRPTEEGVVKIIGVEPTAGRNPLPAFDIDANAQVIKNGVAASWTDLRLYDVMVYNDKTNIVNATDFRITGIYENALPSREAPDEVVTLGGKNFELLPSVRPKLAERKLGETLTFFFTQDGRVADIRTERLPSHQPGITTGDGGVVLYNGMTISGDNPSYGNYGEGMPVSACIYERDKLSLQSIPTKGSVDLDIINMKAGTADITPYAIFIDQSGTGGQAVYVDRTSLPDEIAAGSVISVSMDTAGRANLIVLRNVTGDAWVYGFTSIDRSWYDEDESSSSSSYYTVTVENQYGRRSFYDPRSLGRDGGNNIYGLAVATYGNVIANKACVRVNNVRRSDFSGNSSLVVSGIARPIPDDLMVYVQATKNTYQ